MAAIIASPPTGLAPGTPRPKIDVSSLQRAMMSATLILRCAACGADNRVPSAELERGRRPKCGRCKAPLESDAVPLTVTDATFAAAVECAPLPVLVDAWAPWCGPCRALAPAIDALAAELHGRVRVAKLNVDDNPQTASRFEIRSIPTLLLFVNGREVDRIVGALPPAAIRERLSRALQGRI